MAIELVVFDLAGTTVKDNQDVHRILQQALAAHDVSVTLEDANEVMGIPKPIAIGQLLRRKYNGSRPITINWIAEIHDIFVEKMINFYRTDEGVGEKDGVAETFRRLKEKDLKVIVDTGFDRQITNPLLERMGWAKLNLIDGSVTSDEVERGRPHPDLIYRAMELTNIKDSRNVAKVGDTVSDIEEGKSAGCGLVVAVTTGAFTHNALADAGPTHLIENIRELIGILEKREE
ncbi:MAG: HAD hydrolase-like protein [Chryseolinea sp.]